MSVEGKRCVHCKQEYIYHPSSYGDEDVGQYNHHNYCLECYKVVQEALAKVPVKYKKRFTPSDQYTREQIIAHQESRCASGLPIRRIFPKMIDPTGETRHEVVCEFMPDENGFNGAWYMAQWWTHEPNKVEISKETWCKV